MNFLWIMAMSKQSEFAVLLGLNPLFSGLGSDSINKIAALCHTRYLAAGEILFQKGDSGDALFGIRRGQIRIETGSAAGGRVTMNVLGAGDLFGEIAVLDGQNRTADATAGEPSELFVVRRNDFLAFLESEPRAAVKLIALLCQRIRWASDRFEEAVLLPLEVRLARRLCHLAGDFGSEIHISQEQLGIYVGAARESVNRQLQQWRRQGILEIHRGRILLLNASRLRTAAREN
jgi:CRP/FNR family transcriptional regulator, cyclic AMP receptor protein